MGSDRIQSDHHTITPELRNRLPRIADDWSAASSNDTLACMQIYRFIAIVSLGFMSGIVGCQQQQVTVDPPLSVASAEYHQAIDASIITLRDMNMIVDRQDRRFGVVTTRPQVIGSVLEPWHLDRHDSDQLMASTFNFRRRTVRITVEPAEAGADFTLHVEAIIEQQQRPQQQIHTAAARSISFQGRSGGTQLGEMSPDVEVFWRTVGNDVAMENYIREAIASRLASPAIATDPSADISENQ